MAENNKKNLVKLVIIAIAALIFFLWLANLRSVFSEPVNQENILDNFNKELDKSLKQAAEILGEEGSKESFVDDLLEKASSTKATSSLDIEDVSNNIKEDLSEIIKTASSTLNNLPEDNYQIPTPVKNTNKNCPEYINCMPSIGEARPCVVPSGCEGITLIAY